MWRLVERLRMFINCSKLFYSRLMSLLSAQNVQRLLEQQWNEMNIESHWQANRIARFMRDFRLSYRAELQNAYQASDSDVKWLINAVKHFRNITRPSTANQKYPPKVFQHKVAQKWFRLCINCWFSHFSAWFGIKFGDAFARIYRYEHTD